MIHKINNFGYEYWMDEQRDYHRCDGGPAVIHQDASERWITNDKWHRIDGPAVIDIEGKEKWFYNGKKIIK